MRRRLGLLGPILVLVGALAAAGGSWWIVAARPHAGAFVDVLALDGEVAAAIRKADDAGRSFVELRHYQGEIAWQAMIPRYAGRPGAPGIAASPRALSVRVVRDQHAEIFALSMLNAAKLGGLKLAANQPKHPQGHTLPALVTLTDLRFSYELVGQQDPPAWASLAAIDLATGREQWEVDLGAEPVLGGGVLDGAVWIQQGPKVRGFRASDGAAAEVAVTPLAAHAGDAPVRVLFVDGDRRVEYDRLARRVRLRDGDAITGQVSWPSDAMEPWPYHLAGGRLWIVAPDRLRSVPLDDLARSRLESP
ncbi:MAG: hypothetical protein R3B48_20985 [Kofleriaceae bacterium]